MTSYSDIVWLVVGVISAYWIVTSGIIQQFAMGIGSTPNTNQSRMPKGRFQRGK